MRKRHDLGLSNIGQTSALKEFTVYEAGRRRKFFLNAVGGIVSRCWALSCRSVDHYLGAWSHLPQGLSRLLGSPEVCFS